MINWDSPYEHHDEIAVRADEMFMKGFSRTEVLRTFSDESFEQTGLGLSRMTIQRIENVLKDFQANCKEDRIKVNINNDEMEF